MSVGGVKLTPVRSVIQELAMEGLVTAPSDLAKDFHVYGLEWNQRQLTWYFDGKVIRQRKNDICHSEVAVIFSTAVLKWAGEITDALDGASMDIDYVSVYQYGDGRGGG